MSECVKATINIDCDLLAMSGGWSPAVHLHSHAGGKNSGTVRQQCFVPGESRQAIVRAGAGNWQLGLSDCLQDGMRAGQAAESRCGIDACSIDATSAATRN